jgi:hypothetical protein
MPWGKYTVVAFGFILLATSFYQAFTRSPARIEFIALVSALIVSVACWHADAHHAGQDFWRQLGVAGIAGSAVMALAGESAWSIGHACASIVVGALGQWLVMSRLWQRGQSRPALALLLWVTLLAPVGVVLALAAINSASMRSLVSEPSRFVAPASGEEAHATPGYERGHVPSAELDSLVRAYRASTTDADAMAAMRSSLNNLVVVQEQQYLDHGSYTASWKVIADAAAPGVTLLVTRLGTEGWSAEARFIGKDVKCYTFAGPAIRFRVLPDEVEVVPVCVR